MYERMLDKNAVPTEADMAAHCGGNAALFAALNDWLAGECGTVRQIAFPYGNRYGWGVAHRLNKKLLCNVFAERNAFTVMVRLSDRQFASVYGRLRQAARELVDNRYPCGDGGWIHYRVTGAEELEEIKIILAAKCGR